jgi:ABC-2 type transport system permease protein
VIDLFRAEFLKLRTTRTFVALTAIGVGTSLLIAVLVSILTEPSKETVLTDVFASDTSSFFILLLAVIGITGEWRHRTITSSILAAPDRLRFLTAKTISYAAAGVVVSLAIAIAVGIAGATILSIRELPLPTFGELVGQAGRNAAVAALLGALGVGIGGLLRNQIVAVVAILVLGFVVEPIVIALAPDVGRFGPTGALPVAVADLPADTTGNSDLDLPGVPLATLAMLAWIGAFVSPAALLLQRRDLE